MYFNNQIPLTADKLLRGVYSEIKASLNNSLPQGTFSHGLSFSIMGSEFAPMLPDEFPHNKEF